MSPQPSWWKAWSKADAGEVWPQTGAGSPRQQVGYGEEPWPQAEGGEEPWLQADAGEEAKTPTS